MAESVVARKGYVIVQEVEVSPEETNSVPMETNSPEISICSEAKRVTIMSGSKSGNDAFVLPWGSLYSIPDTDMYIVSEENIIADITD